MAPCVYVLYMVSFAVNVTDIKMYCIVTIFSSISRSRAHIQRTDPTNVGLITASTEEDGCSLESGDIDEAELLSSQNESVS